MFNAGMRYEGVRSYMRGIKATLSHLLFIVFLAFVGSSCNLVNPTEITPTYIHIDSFTFTRNPALPSWVSNSHQITSVWVYYNNNPIGVFDLPVTFPVMAVGNGKLTFTPGIMIGGLNSFNAPYPFYQPDTLTIAAQPGKVINYVPSTHYYSTVAVKSISDFEFGAPNFMLLSGSVELNVTNIDSNVFEGEGAGEMLFSLPADTLSEDSSIRALPIPLNVDAYVELNYKNSVPFSFGLRSNLASYTYGRYIYGAFASDHWQKFYIPVKDFVANYKGDNFNFLIKATLPAGQASGRVLLDNIQLVYFE